MGVFSNNVFLVIFIFNAKSFPRLCLISLRKNNCSNQKYWRAQHPYSNQYLHCQSWIVLVSLRCEIRERWGGVRN